MSTSTEGMNAGLEGRIEATASLGPVPEDEVEDNEQTEESN